MEIAPCILDLSVDTGMLSFMGTDRGLRTGSELNQRHDVFNC